MAKWEERDPRWIVEERPDAKNVNSWHWEEKNCMEWAKERLNALFLEIKNESENRKYSVNKVDTVSGELNWYNRKGKRFILFELDITLGWEAEISGEQIKGTLSAKEVAQDEEEKAEWKLAVKEGKLDNKTTSEFKKSLIKDTAAKIRQMMDDLFKLQEEKIPKNNNDNLKTSDTKNLKIEDNNEKPKEIPKKEEKVSNFSEWNVKYTFQANPADLYDCLLNPQKIQAYTRSPAQCENKVGGKFSFYSGAIVGEIVELEKDTKIVLNWKLKDWPSFSVVTLSFSKNNGTVLILNQKEIPTSEFERTRSGWKNYFWDPIRLLFGFNYTEK
eukprot:TRINITY_DN876_c0_g1_i1.p1 TRINITY_DN876_c0_g1~~TRINITY_DN876_c0_g1_i1.p1  ORF type:complete len:344 (+),score=103.34 TRINITY_DN876_c0_g1_i1:46-1032(+)